MLRKAFRARGARARPARRPGARRHHRRRSPRTSTGRFEGPFGKFDQAQLQRGYKVYREVCSACHSMNLM